MPPVIDPKLCTACGTCWGICPGDVFYGSKKGEQPLITYPDECWHEASCVHDCPVEGAIKLRIPLPMMISHK